MDKDKAASGIRTVLNVASSLTLAMVVLNLLSLVVSVIFSVTNEVCVYCGSKSTMKRFALLELELD